MIFQLNLRTLGEKTGMTKKVLVTGMSGLIGQAVYKNLGSQYDLSALNRRKIPNVSCHRADISNLDAIQPAFEGKDSVVHLAAEVAANATWEKVLHHNIIGTYTVFEASRRAGVKRIIYASSGATISKWEDTQPYKSLVQGIESEIPRSWEKLTKHSPTRPSGLYGCSKVWGEVLARHFTDTSPLSILCVRIGAVNVDNRPSKKRDFSVWCSQGDIVHMIESCLKAPENLKYDVFFAISNNILSYRDIKHAQEKINFQPLDSADNYR